MRELLIKAKQRLKEGAGWVWERRLRVSTLILVLALLAIVDRLMQRDRATVLCGGVFEDLENRTGDH